MTDFNLKSYRELPRGIEKANWICKAERFKMFKRAKEKAGENTWDL
jgi:hypothetical protein